MDVLEKRAAVSDRDKRYDGVFVYAVKTTGIYCRPSCPSRQAKPENMLFFDLPDDAEKNGFRACKRCRPDFANTKDPLFSMIRQVSTIIRKGLEENPDDKVSLAHLSAETGYNEDYLARSFKQVMGVSPFEYYDMLRNGKLRENLKRGENVSSAAYGAGFGSSSRLYEKAHERLGMTPASYAKGGKGAEIAYAIVDCFLGKMLIGGTRKGVCAVYFGDSEASLLDELKAEFPEAEIAPEIGDLAEWTAKISTFLERKTAAVPEIPLDMFGTAFQRRVWQELLKIAPGETKTYKQIADDMGRHKSARAVGRACATNPVSLIVPCHRVIGSDGKLHGYRWGLERKELLRRWELTE
ncbi:bifunctional transcriptional activator/DNA repair enzyme AdaA [Sneathiella aquimaris]|uniref:bifunctional transcriptional activator/DNA repair enzyme AdaA n=1 Tax=Sneathiella aquimaris TaxID=2599305 RepID=UPI00146F76B0|nr:methylated-DNA--[protein]-cysteine S-methyltransferase [Sneathiella aquimaris]